MSRVVDRKIMRTRGDTYPVEVTMNQTKKIDGVKVTTPIDFSAGGYTAKFSYKRGTTINTIPGLNGTVDGEISFDFPAAIGVGQYAYDIQIIDPSGKIQTAVKDLLEIIGDVTI